MRTVDDPAPQLEKSALRDQALARRDVLADMVRIAAAQTLAQVAPAIDAHKGLIVSGFWPIRSEIDPRPLMAALAARGLVLALPAVIDRETIIFRRYGQQTELVAGGFGTMAPGPGAETLDPDIMLMPLSAFDGAGNRIGYGAGHYDRAITRLHAAGKRPRLIGLAFECQRVDTVPNQAHDVPLDMIITENGLQAFASHG